MAAIAAPLVAFAGADANTGADACTAADNGDDADAETGTAAALATTRDVTRTAGTARDQKIPRIPLPLNRSITQDLISGAKSVFGADPYRGRAYRCCC
jgi:hypothetical protein